MQNDPGMELGLWDGNQEMHLQLLRHIRKTASKIITGEKNFSHPCQGGSRMQQENIRGFPSWYHYVPAMRSWASYLSKFVHYQENGKDNNNIYLIYYFEN